MLARLGFYTWVLVLFWTCCIVTSLLWNLHVQNENILEMAQASARLTYENDVLYRRWAARQGGVYVKVSEDTPPNPYLKVPDRDVTTTSGLSLTLVNPAYMVRLVHEGETGGTLGHITSLRPLRPENGPDAWETAALQAFERGDKETISMEQTSNGKCLRFMRPIFAEQACLKCHAVQGYKEGDIRGGISISVPMGLMHTIGMSANGQLALAHIVLWMIGLMGIVLPRRSLRRQILAREEAEDSLVKINTELEQRVADQVAEVRKANETLEQRVAERTSEIKSANKELNDSRRAALNLMDDAVMARQQAEQAAAMLVQQANELRSSNEDLARFNSAAVDRELRMVELKKQVNELCLKAGLPPEYKMEFD